MDLKLSMFQCMVSTNEYNAFDLNVLYKHYLKKGVCVIPYAPGSLGQVVHDVDTHQVGSLNVKYMHQGKRYSVLVFKNNKIKISGGFVETREIPTCVQYVLHPIIERILCDLDVIEPTDSFVWTSCMVNGNAKRNKPIDKQRYISFIDSCEKEFPNQVVRPTAWDPTKKQRGRICSIKIKSKDRGTMIVDHSGNVQLFGFVSTSHLVEQYHRLVALF